VSSKSERRRTTRFSANCQCWIEQEAITLFGTVTNLSEEGLFLQTLPIIECGSVIEIRLNLQDLGDLHARGKVKWKSMSKPESTTGAQRPSSPPGMGIEFQEVLRGGDLLTRYFSNRSIIPPPAKKLD